MKKYFHFIIAAAVITVSVYAGFGEPEKKMICPKCYVMHPEFFPLDRAGNRTGNPAALSEERTCGECHNTEFINAHNSHYGDTAKIECSACHAEGGKITLAPGTINPDGTIDRDALKIRVPSDANCLACHGVGSIKGKDVFIPDDFPGALVNYEGGKCFRVTCKTGEILSPENISDSLINIRDRDTLQFPWDVHLQREVACVSCHFTRNDPRRAETRVSDQEHLANDPRKSYSIGKYLYIPDHRLLHADCRTCHNPEKKHDFLPYRDRHFAVLSCQSCHVPRLYGPALRSVDETVITAEGNPRYEFRGRETENGSNLNTAYTEGFEPFLVSHNEKKPGAEEITGVKDGVSPVNLMLRWKWTDGNGKAVPFTIVKGAYLDGQKYHADVLGVFDADGSGAIERGELRLDTQAKVDCISRRLAAAGVKDPAISGVSESYRVNHGVAHEKSITPDCLRCHSGTSRFGDGVDLSSFIPVGAAVKTAGIVETAGLAFHLDGTIETGKDGTRLVKDGIVTSRYIFGYSSHTWLNVLGFLILVISMAGTAGHGVLRYLAQRGVERKHGTVIRVKAYALYERIWHWGMALSVIVLIITGLEVHYAGSFALMGFENAVDVHNFFAALVTLNAGLSLFYHLATGEILQYIRVRKGFRGEVIVQAAYYLYGIFRGTGHPFEKTAERKLNPLQQLTYFALLNVLFPVQIVTGIMMWLVSVWPGFSSAVGGLTLLAPVHNFFAWLFITFLAVHLYLITTGHTVFSNLKAMITGTEEMEEGGSAREARDSLSDITLTHIIDNIRKIAEKALRGKA
ncbi:MAG: cytochrome b/b6 domain-containing protein [Spirochaetes bacterium]|nr:cytochrome b/b6 domain-containing protein [Spirochaetota bacterium]